MTRNTAASDSTRKPPTGRKFPVPTKLALLQYEAKRHANEQAGKMLYDTLDKMAAGGIYDHVGGGFHRYSTDRFWRVPHFEKMLYDNAQLADVYAEAYRHTNQRHYKQIAEETIEFVFRELRDHRRSVLLGTRCRLGRSRGKILRLDRWRAGEIPDRRRAGCLQRRVWHRRRDRTSSWAMFWR